MNLSLIHQAITSISCQSKMLPKLSLGNLTLALALAIPAVAQSQMVRVKDLVNYKGMRSNDLTGFGLVVGLPGTGDSAASVVTVAALKNLYERLGYKIEGDAVLTQSVAAVIVTAKLPPFAKNGDNIGMRISTMGDAKSLAGGTLVLTPLRAGDGKVYAIAQGGLTIGAADGNPPRSMTTVPMATGAVVERQFVPFFAKGGKLDMYLKSADLTTHSRMVKAINREFRDFIAVSKDPSHIQVKIPAYYGDDPYSFLEKLEQVKVKTDTKAVVVINEKTGTVVMGNNVLVDKVFIHHDSVAIEVSPDKIKNVVDIGGATVGQLMDGLNSLGLSSKDLVSILKSLKAAGALKAELKIL